MDKQLLKAYIKTIVEDEVKKVLPELLSEAISEIKNIKNLQENTQPNAVMKKPTFDRSKLAEMMGLQYENNTLLATTNSMPSPLPENIPRDVDPEVVKAVTRDYSALMKKLNIT
jgi:hypothetical protein